MMRLDGQVALVTGGTGVIGGAIAETFAHAGADVIVVARTKSRLEEFAASLSCRSGRRVVAAAGDVGDASSVAAVLRVAADAFDRIDVLVNNTFAIGGERPIVDLDAADWDEPWRVNVLGPALLAKGCAPRMMAGDGGSIINVLTTAAFLPLTPMAPYGVTKAGLWTLTRYLARECAPKVRVNAITPGTTSGDGEVTFASWQTALPHVPLARMGLATETASAALFLASSASSYTTGQNLFVDGGRVNCIAGGVGGSTLTSEDAQSPAVP
jgi:NAD(P)-dependent dehydrogenase (short-subunit alcohol dehydrogenase family)